MNGIYEETVMNYYYWRKLVEFKFNVFTTMWAMWYLNMFLRIICQYSSYTQYMTIDNSQYRQ